MFAETTFGYNHKDEKCGKYSKIAGRLNIQM